MDKRSIVIFPEFKESSELRWLREIYDPLEQVLNPHITLIHPFDSDVSDSEIIEHISKVISSWNSFNILTGPLYPTEQHNLFLLLSKGNENVLKLHTQLNTVPLIDLGARVPYIPHITIGRFNKENNLNMAVDALHDFQNKFEATVKKICFNRIIGHNGDSEVIREFVLGD